MQVIAWDGDQRYLVSLDGDLNTAQKMVRPLGRVLDLSVHRFMIPRNLHSLLSMGGWQPITVSDMQLQQWLTLVEDRYTPAMRERDFAKS